MRHPIFHQLLSHTPAPVRFLLGTDRHIGEELSTAEKDYRETRVAIVPNDIASLIEAWRAAGMNPEVKVVEGAGEQSGFANNEYVRAGAQIISEADLTGSTTWSPDIVHALKEPSAYELKIPGKFMRIGALHVRDVSKHSAYVHLYRSTACIIDGSEMGGYAYTIRGGAPIPLRQSMSAFAGTLGGEDVAMHLSQVKNAPKKVVVCGCGVAGEAAIKALIYSNQAENLTIHMLDARPEALARIKALAKPGVTFTGRAANTLMRRDLEGAQALIIAAYKDPEQPSICNLRDLEGMQKNSYIVDISADEGPSIAVDGLKGLDGEEARKHVAKVLEACGHSYAADTHMPRRDPRRASESHSRAVWPYIYTLGVLVGALGGSEQAAHYLKTKHLHSKAKTRGYFDLMIDDLAAGLFNFKNEIVHRVVKADPELHNKIRELSIHPESFEPGLSPSV
ncbi:hypothetical protein JNK13_10690 [bacterium]|nr:hypothetical protein [bacterium]